MRLALACVLASAIALGGCAQILGLSGTKPEAAPDAFALDAPSVCDAPPACTFSAGGSICGQVYTAGTGLPMRVAVPTGAVCAGETDGPCGLEVAAYPIDTFGSQSTGMVAGSIDDCGRYTVTDFDDTVADVAVVFGGTGFAQTASFAFDRPTSPGAATGIEAWSVTTDLQQGWATSATTNGASPDLSTAYIVRFDSVLGPQDGDQVRYNGGNLGGPPSTPWAAYFSGSAFDTLDLTLTTTAASGTALIVPDDNQFELSGYRLGKTCTPYSDFFGVTGFLLFLPLENC